MSGPDLFYVLLVVARYLHPKEVLISNGVLQPDLVTKKHLLSSKASSALPNKENTPATAANIVPRALGKEVRHHNQLEGDA